MMATDGHVDAELNAFSPAWAMLDALREGQISAVELLELHYARIDRYNRALNAVVWYDDVHARRMAAKADRGRICSESASKGASTPTLLGLPITVKDSVHVRGMPTTSGLPERADALAREDAPAVARLRSAGAVILGQTNLPPFAGDWQSDNPLYGRSNNPWDVSRTPGGSTGGGAAAVAAGMSPLELGSDIGGSIRVPSAFCGIYGHKPSETAVRSVGHLPGSSLPNAARAMAVQGPLARCAEDLELALDVIAGPQAGESVAWRLELPPARHQQLSDYRVAVLPAVPWLPVDPEIGGALDALATQLGRSGATVKETQPSAFGDLRNYYRTYRRLLSALVNAGRGAADRHREADAMRAQGDAFDDMAWADGLEASASDYLTWFAHRERYRAALRAFFLEWDVLLSPADIVCAFPHMPQPMPERWFEIGGQRVPYGRQALYPSLASLSGHPATVFPVGLNQGRLPIGLQAIGPYLEDRTTIRFAALVGQAYGGYQRPPGYEG
jgi:amidase